MLSNDHQQGYESMEEPGAYHSAIPDSVANPYDGVGDYGGGVGIDAYGADGGVVGGVEQTSPVVRLRGIPFNASNDDVRAFAKGYLIDDPDGVLVMQHGDRRGEAYIRFVDSFEAERFEAERHRQHMGERYIEIYLVFPDDMKRALEQEMASGSMTKNPIVRLRGLPFGATTDDVALFFSQCGDRIVNIRFVEDVSGRRTGDAFLELSDEDAVSIALTKHRLLMGTRYVEVSRTTAGDREAVLHVASRRGRGGVPVNQMPVGPFDFGPDGMPAWPFPFLPPWMMLPPRLPTLGPDGQIKVQIGEEAAKAAAATQAANLNSMLAMQAAMLGMPPPGLPLGPGKSGKSRRGGAAEGEDGESGEADEETAEADDENGSQPVPAITPPSPLVPPSPQPRQQSRYIIRVRGLPFSASEETVAEFFSDVNIQPQGVHMVYNTHDKPTGEAFVEVESEADVHRALEHNGGALGHRYIEVFKSGPSDMQRLGGGPPQGHHRGGPMPPPMMLPPFGFPPYGFPPMGYGWGY